ncbi:chemotaxis-specific protein-glutamate methyltransferase CheB [Geoalkalibacter subterraneus]|uniref:Protein-glutamate methylesterase/protein-glutamine glutaminase n=1 Tax=Geoalkalibacter subterraneus TaxID=483547 RepID=A0A0B5FB28_9BACT|nr:chemotaxis-specific protein-glutamate methyltransferase CheB [Geoalkalibacter subterraneus]AJF05367.1 hypothetical protein GSUB_00500 [Geoalkalibacter subterraneus]
MKKIKIVIADDSLLTRVVLRDILRRDAEIEVVAEARNGREALDAVLRCQPDLVIMDVVMPVMDGISAVREIMARRPTPILILSSSVRSHDARGAFHAIDCGALDVMSKPRGMVKDVFEPMAEALVEKVKLLARLPVRRLVSERPRTAAAISGSPAQRSVLAIGASTGGPKTVLSVLRNLSPATQASILVVQHIAAGFAEGFALWLDRETPFPASLAREGDVPRPGHILVAPHDRHMELRDGRILLTDGPMVNSCRPSIDVLFAGLAHEQPEDVVALLLTGMGRDGAEGMAALKLAGAVTLAQDEASCVVFGMPKAAIALGGVQQTLALHDIPRALGRLLKQK